MLDLNLELEAVVSHPSWVLGLQEWWHVYILPAYIFVHHLHAGLLEARRESWIPWS